MGNVIHVDFQQGRQLCEREAYLQIVAVELDELDFQDFVEAVNDPLSYRMADQDIQDLVDGFWACRA